MTSLLLAIVLFPLLLAVWLWWPVADLSRRSRRWHVGLTVALGLLAPLIGVLWRSHALGDVVVAWAQLLFGCVMALFLFALLLTVLRDVLWLPLRLLRRGAAVRAWLHGARVNHAIVAVAAALTAWGLFNGIKPPRVHEHELALRTLPRELDGLRVAVISDLHATPVKAAWRTRRVVDAVLAVKPDMIVLPGDLEDGQVASDAVNLADLARLQAPYGVWVAPGNHEYYNNYAQWVGYFRKIGLGVLENQTVKLRVKGRTLAVSGIGDLAFYQRREFIQGGGIAPDIPGVAQQAKGSDFHILVAHQPKQARAAAASGAVDLQISGHTHGGHIIGLDRWVIAPLNDGYVRGSYAVGGMELYVSSGAGQWDGFDIRLGVPPSIDVLVLRSAEVESRN